jgi:hypothetical protein
MKCTRVLAAILCAMLSGCLPVATKTPVGTTAGLGTDAALYGSWKGSPPATQGEVTVHFLKLKDGTLSVVQAFSSGKHDDDGWESYTVQTAALGGQHYLNVVWTSENGKPVDDAKTKAAIFPLRYTLKGRTLTLYMLDEDKVKAAIQAGKIAGTVEPGDTGDVVLTAEAKALDAYFASPAAARLYKLYLVLKKTE